MRFTGNSSQKGTAAARKGAALSAAACAALLSFSATPAKAEDTSAENKAAARDLATEGIKLAESGKCEQAIPKLSRAEKLFHAPTILTWLGQCQIELGRLVEGTETLTQVARENLDEGAPEAYKNAQEKSRDLIAQTQPRIAKLTIEVEPNDIDDLQVSVDDRTISSALVGAPKPTDPGNHKVTVSAPGYRSITKEIELGAGARESLSFKLVALPEARGASPEKGSAGAAATPEEAKSSPNWIGWTAVGAGTLLMAGGGVTGYLAMSREGDLNCADDGVCPRSEEDTLKSARTNATVSTILFGVGGAVTVTGVVLLITGSAKSDAARGRYVQPLVGFGSVGMSGAF